MTQALIASPHLWQSTLQWHGSSPGLAVVTGGGLIDTDASPLPPRTTSSARAQGHVETTDDSCPRATSPYELPADRTSATSHGRTLGTDIAGIALEVAEATSALSITLRQLGARIRTSQQVEYAP